MRETSEISSELFTYNSLKDALYDRRLAPGTALTERNICNAFQVGRTPLRAALKRLADEGFVEIIPNRGAFVITTTKEQFAMLFDARIELHMTAIRRGINAYTENDFKTLDEIIEKEKAAAHNACFKTYLDCIGDFFNFIMEKGNNSILLELHAMLYNKMRILLVLYDDFYAPVSTVDSFYTHIQIVQALHAKNVGDVECILREHSQRVIRKIRFHNTATANVDLALKYNKLEE